MGGLGLAGLLNFGYKIDKRTQDIPFETVV